MKINLRPISGGDNYGGYVVPEAHLVAVARIHPDQNLATPQGKAVI